MKYSTFTVFGCLSAAALLQASAQTPGEGPAVQITVTAEPRHGQQSPPVTQNDVAVSSGKEQLTVLDWKPAADGASLQLFILIDDGANSSLGTQFPELKKFFAALPANAAVALGYMRNGTVERAQDFTTDHMLLAKKLRLPISEPGADASPYFSLQELIKHWPMTANATGEPRREVLMITDGVDRYYGRGPDNPYVESAFTDALRKGVIVSSIYWNSVGHYGHSRFLMNWGQNYLAQVAQETGGEAYWQGFGDPVSFGPYLEDFSRRLNNQYELTIRANPRNKPGLQNIKIRTEIRDVDLVAPSSVWVP